VHLLGRVRRADVKTFILNDGQIVKSEETAEALPG
jgi:hypothetical protein